MKTQFLSLVAAAAVVALAGCAGLAGAIPPLPGASASPGPGATAPTATAAPGATTAPTATTAPAATAAPAGAGLGTAEDCTRTLPAETDTGTAKLGQFNGQRLPKGWVAAYNSEAEVYKGIDNLYQNDWPCFQKFYPGAAGLYKTYKGI